ncbi:MAG: plastocyanin/azurin family copper-binding protein [Chloroflexota bacterium]|nr:plastocyanin/azurin family copper-binding protein [Chloroflexota bacterium]
MNVSHLRPIILVAAMALAACGPQAVAGSAPSTAQVQIASFRFQPAELTIAAGTTVTWTNGDDILHTVTTGTSVKKDDFGNYDIAPDGRINGALPEKGKTFSFTFTTAGEYAYFCSRHNNMTARVVVR